MLKTIREINSDVSYRPDSNRCGIYNTVRCGLSAQYNTGSSFRNIPNIFSGVRPNGLEKQQVLHFINSVWFRTNRSVDIYMNIQHNKALLSESFAALALRKARRYTQIESI
jgi:hypothetical protein